jgi:hypothetical protein
MKGMRKHLPEAGLIQAREDSQEPSSTARLQVLNESSRIFPETEPVSVMEWIAAYHGDEGEEEQPDHEQNLEDGHVELRDTKVSHSDRVQEGVDDNHSHDDSLDRYLVRPKGDHDIHRNDLERDQDGHVQEEVPCHGESKCTVYPFATKANERRWYREVRNHLGEAFVDGPHDTSPDDEGDEETCWAAFRKRRAHLYIQRFTDVSRLFARFEWPVLIIVRVSSGRLTCTDRTADREELNLLAAKASM